MLRPLSSPLTCLLIFLFSPLFAHAQRSFSVGTASATPGEKGTGYLEVPTWETRRDISNTARRERLFPL
jgi:hypothetical protein